ncbi:TrmB family transcriptional regulator [Halogeometricum limi]|uniref:Sugar-specific transcriptional regulator TrmB n=1 Tax=Halogeometricum limi TaxID=555875 RepID=A0A1I6I9W0_9EURY|nr:TrmB family transcriptional regulator sugar-binding domain-containing protein [Halogeometricum limi]SFR63471.1 Sugar-specific transcriptional regulator TrmB [Halogeometricum limi]
MTERELLQELQDLGLTEYQSKTYLAAVRAGEARPSELVDDSGVPQGRIYGVIDALEEMGLLEVRSGTKGKEVSAPSPKAVLDDLKRRRIDDLTETVSSVASGLEELHQRTDGEPRSFVSMVKRDETALRHAKRAIDAAEYWLTVSLPNERYAELEPRLVAAAERGVTVRVLFVGTDPDEIGRVFPEQFSVRHRAAADTFVVADRTYGIFSSKHPIQDRQPYIITQEQNLVLLFQNYAEQVWDTSRVVQSPRTFPRRYLDPWRVVIELRDQFDAGAQFSAVVRGRRTGARERETWEGPVVAYDVSGSDDGTDYMSSPPTYASLTVETPNERVTVGGWKATFEDVAASGIEVRRLDPQDESPAKSASGRESRAERESASESESE